MGLSGEKFAASHDICRTLRRRHLMLLVVVRLVVMPSQ